jgi:hypothetical protein
MRSNQFAFVLFATAILFSMVREWSAPVVCARTIFLASSPAAPR